MLTEAKSSVPWDLADKKTQKRRFSNDSFYIIVDGVQSDSVRQACVKIKAYISGCEGVRSRGPKAMPTERRRYMVMRELKAKDTGKGMYLTRPIRYRNILLVINPSSGFINGLINLTLPSDVNIKVEAYENQFDLREDRR